MLNLVPHTWIKLIFVMEAFLLRNRVYETMAKVRHLLFAHLYHYIRKAVCLLYFYPPARSAKITWPLYLAPYQRNIVGLVSTKWFFFVANNKMNFKANLTYNNNKGGHKLLGQVKTELNDHEVENEKPKKQMAGISVLN